MAAYGVDEVDKTFKDYWSTGQANEDWSAWADFFTEDCEYYERVQGHSWMGRERVRNWIDEQASLWTEWYTIYEWHDVFPDGRVIVYMQNRVDHPSGDGVLDVPGISMLQYAGNGLWSREEDYWSPPAAEAVQAELTKWDPNYNLAGFKPNATRNDWTGSGLWQVGRGETPDWAIGAPSHAESIGGRKRAERIASA